MTKLHYGLCLTLSLLFFTLSGTCVRAQTTVLQQDFEGQASDNLPFTASPATYNANGDVWAVVASEGSITPSTGTMFWGGRDVNNAAGTNRSILSFDAGEVCNLTSARFVFDYNVFEFDTGDDFGYTLYIDGFQTADVVLVDGVSNRSSNGWETQTVSIPGTADNARLEIWARQRGNADYFGIDNVRVTASGTDGTCNAVCGLTVNDQDIEYNCAALTEGVDGVTAVIPYSGAELNVVVSTDNGTVGGDNPATTADGEITVSGLTEGQTATVTFSGGDCDFTVSLSVPADQCEAGDVIINEFQFSPTVQEFIEVVSISATPLDVTGYTVEDATGNQVDFPAVTLEFGDGVVFAIDPSSVGGGCYVEAINGFGLNDATSGGDVIIVRDASGSVIAQVTYTGTEVPSGESLARNPDADPNAPFEPHSDVDPAGALRSPCHENINPAIGLPLDLLSFTGRAVGKTAHLRWTTANEEAVAGFTVERLLGDNDWEFIGVVPARNVAAAAYTFTDQAPRAGSNLYRLRQTDRDGTTVLHGTVAVIVTADEMTVYPNPATDELRLGAGLITAETTLLDAAGRTLGRWPAGTTAIDVSTLKSGVYVLRARWADEQRTLRFVKR